MGLLDRLGMSRLGTGRLGIGRPSEAEVTAQVRAALGAPAEPPSGGEPTTYLQLPQGGSLSGAIAVPDVAAYDEALGRALGALVDALGSGPAARVVVYLTGRTPEGSVLTPAELGAPSPVLRDLLPRLSNPG